MKYMKYSKNLVNGTNKIAELVVVGPLELIKEV